MMEGILGWLAGTGKIYQAEYGIRNPGVLIKGHFYRQ